MSAVIVPEVIDDAAEVINTGVESGVGSEDFDIGRKLLSLAILFVKDTITPEAAATESDARFFEAATGEKVGKGEMTVEDACDQLVDRAASSFASTVSEVLAEFVDDACALTGEAIGAFFGYPELGRLGGETVGRFLNKPVMKLIRSGVEQVVTFGRKIWNWTKRVVASTVSEVADALLN